MENYPVNLFLSGALLVDVPKRRVLNDLIRENLGLGE